MVVVVKPEEHDEYRREFVASIAELLQSQGWMLLRVAIERHRQEIRLSLSSPKQTDDLGKVRKLQGEIEGLDWVLGAPDREIARLSAATTAAER